MKKIIVLIMAIIFAMIAVFAVGCKESMDSYKFEGKLSIEENSELKILMLTDIHITAGKFKTVEEMKAALSIAQAISNITAYQRDIWALQTVTDLIEATNPDLIIVTGDMTYVKGESQIFNYLGHTDNLKAMKVFAEHMESFKIPWAPIFGNHDHEGDYSRGEIADYLTTLEYCVFDKGPSDINGFGNYTIDIVNSDGSHNTSIILMDSNSYREENLSSSGYDSIHDNQIEWYEQKLTEIKDSYSLANLPQSLLFFHIPVKEVKTIKSLYNKGQNTEEYTFFEGVIGEEPSIPRVGDYKGKYYNGGNMFDKVVELGSTKGIFVGHDHINNFIAKYKDVLMVNGKSIDYIAYVIPDICKNDDYRGATLITLKDKSEFLYDGVDNKPVVFVPYDKGLYNKYVAASEAGE